MAASFTPFKTDNFRDVVHKETELNKSSSPDVFHGPCTVYAIRITNTGGGAVHAHIKVYDELSATYATRPLLAFPIGGGEDRMIYMGEGLKFNKGCTIRASSGIMEHTSSDGTDPAVAVNLKVIGREE